MVDRSVALKVAEAAQSDVSLGRARIDTTTRMAIGAEVGDIVEILGKKSTVAKIFRTLSEDEGKGLIRIDGLVRRNAGVSIGDKIEVRKAEVINATKVTMAPMLAANKRVTFGEGIEAFVKRGLSKRPLTKGDTVVVPGIALMGGALPFIVVSTAPKGIVQITDSTEVG
jgi:transitional endoplasmic reticulum ATPase